ncbi:cytochrome P450 [Myxococcus sp. RHSTA-1-4]|uniref:cytochrome P450 n=1 Tax=Myxococcus sp. RHSTA-1-4 TaxID=2874601 RepID=UPI001CBE00B9|nr:cytochrome P450 [Myxococcus sp. RHSTA-1-4]MBZ4415050.1 cytochrome P450 [Myxococcus sp. RHSTA-1-4]
MQTDSPLPPRVELPAVQQSLQWRARPYELLRSCRERLGDAFTLDLGSHGTYVMFSHPDALRDIFTADPSVLHAGEGNVVLKPLLGAHSLLLLEEKPHQRERRMLGPAFHSRRIEQYGALVREATLAAIQDWRPGQSVIIQDVMQRVSLRVILTAVFGLEGGERAEELSARIQAFLNDSKFNLGNIGQLRDDLQSEAWAAFKRSLERIDALLLEEVRHRRAVRDVERGDILGMLLSATYEDGAPLEDAVLRDELMTLVVTGYETTATAIAWALHWLHAFPGTLARLREELRGLGAEPAPSALAGSAAPWLKAVCQETLRLHPIIPVVARRTQVPFRVQGYEVPSGVTVAACIYLAHHRPEAFTEPEDFRPERFLERAYSPFEYLPFGGGVRRCIGMALALYEMKVVLGLVLSRFELKPMDAQVRPQRRAVTLAPSGGLRMTVERLCS